MTVLAIALGVITALLTAALWLQRSANRAGRRHHADLAAMVIERDATIRRLHDRIAAVQTAMHRQRINQYTLLARIKQLEAGDESVALTRPADVFAEQYAARLVTEVEDFLRQGGEQR